jgi:hypothetical protein
MTNRPVSIALLRQALGYGGDRKNYNLRIARGYEFCKRWLEKNQDFHGIELDDGVLETLRSMCEKKQ